MKQTAFLFIGLLLCLSSCVTSQKINSGIKKDKFHVAEMKELLGNYPDNQTYLVELYNYLPVVDSMRQALDEQLQYLGLKQTAANKIKRYKKRENKQISKFEQKHLVIQSIIRRGFANTHFKQLCFKKSTDKNLENLACTASKQAPNQTYIYCTFYEKTTKNSVRVYEGDGNWTTKTMPTYEVLLTLKNQQNNKSISILKKTSLKTRESNGGDDGKDAGPSKATAYQAVMAELIESVNLYEFFKTKQ